MCTDLVTDDARLLYQSGSVRQPDPRPWADGTSWAGGRGEAILRGVMDGPGFPELQVTEASNLTIKTCRPGSVVSNGFALAFAIELLTQFLTAWPSDHGVQHDGRDQAGLHCFLHAR